MQLEQITTVFSLVLLLCAGLARAMSLKRFEDPYMKRSKAALKVYRDLFFKEVIPPASVEVGPGSSTVLMCEAGGNPPPTIHWLRNGERIKQGIPHDSADETTTYERHNRGPVQIGNTKSELVIDCASRASEGTYTCVAETPTRIITTDSEVIFNEKMPSKISGKCLSRAKKQGSQEPARIVMWTSDRAELAGADVQLYCRATGARPLHYTWFKEDGEVIEGKRDEYEVLPNGDLLIRNVNFENHMGGYKCEAKNAFGKDTTSGLFYVFRP
ncbi:zwei Ig domain protein zig-4 [Lingula anatina]|uniref:Zwei Ig domain protein zig-4 n=1 Tax=Lingula anatina TaxID=7574 RepID=A0A1S3KCZ2_LINAN|nr:zwei Ig domain protein zig-4 [Lingula anatina]|eukprot:XP_013420495.1 zwei Ig domain protein zig-4 [Lingula anatina]